MFIETLADPILHYSGTSATFCGEDGIQGFQYFVVLLIEFVLAVTAARATWKMFSYFGWWGAVWREINGTREELSLMAEEEW